VKRLPSSVATLPRLKGCEIIETRWRERESADDHGKRERKAFRATRVIIFRPSTISARTSLAFAPSRQLFSPGTLPYLHGWYPAVRLNTPRRSNLRKHAWFVPSWRERKRKSQTRGSRRWLSPRLDYKRKKIYNPRTRFIYTSHLPSPTGGIKEHAVPLFSQHSFFLRIESLFFAFPHRKCRGSVDGVNKKYACPVLIEPLSASASKIEDEG